MFCPRCSTKQISDQTSFCSRCGLALNAVAELVVNDGKPEEIFAGIRRSRTRRVARQSLFMLAAAAVILPITALVVIFTGSDRSQIFIPAAAVVAIALIRIFTTAVYQSASTSPRNIETRRKIGRKIRQVLHEKRHPVLEVPIRNPYSTDDLSATPPSVTDNTTKLL